MTTFTNIPKQVDDVLEKWNGTTSRRNFLKSSGLFVVSFSAAALAGPIRAGTSLEAATPLQSAGPYPDPDFRQIDSWIVIHEENTATFYVGKTDCGQGTGTALRQMMSDDVRAEVATPATQHSSIIIVIATDAPLLPTQLRRLARRAGLGLARTGGMANNGSGDIFLAFSTANENVNQSGSDMTATTLANDNMSPLFDATVEAVEEAIINAMIAARDMTGTEGHVAKAIDHEVLRTILRKHDLLQDRQ